MSRFDLVIFDCDGVLVDSERLAIRTEAQVLARLGWPLSEHEVAERFVGRPAAYMREQIELHLGRSIDWRVEFEQRHRDVFARELVAVDGVREVIDDLTIPICVASSGTHEAIQYSLELTQLLEPFAGRIFSAEDVNEPKPAPDIFLLAARTMNVDPQRCAVIEDSVAGATAGVRAGMTVFGYTNSVTPAVALEFDGVTTFSHMSQLPELLR